MYLEIDKGKILLSHDGPFGRKVEHVIESVDDYDKLVGPLDDVFCSSTMDYPEDTTADEATIALARRIRNGG